MKQTAFLRLTAALVLALLLGTALLNYLVDPLLHFHAPWFGLEPVLTNARYQNAGCIRHLEYDNAVLGNSMCENFQASWICELLGATTVKLPMSGSCTANLSEELSLLEQRPPKHILMNMDYDVLSILPEDSNYTLPHYLYDGNPFNDVNYLLNLEITAEHTIPALLANFAGETTDMETVYEWAQEQPVGKEYALAEFADMDLAEEPVNTIQEAINHVHTNLGILEQHISAMPDTDFVFFFPPWSALYWHLKTLVGEMDAIHAAYLEAVPMLLRHENVKLFFWNDEEILAIASDLDNYRDITHYSKDISRLLIDRMAAQDGILTLDNYAQKMDSYFRFWADFPYDTLFSR